VVCRGLRSTIVTAFSAGSCDFSSRPAKLPNACSARSASSCSSRPWYVTTKDSEVERLRPCDGDLWNTERDATLACWYTLFTFEVHAFARERSECAETADCVILDGQRLHPKGRLCRQRVCRSIRGLSCDGEVQSPSGRPWNVAKYFKPGTVQPRSAASGRATVHLCNSRNCRRFCLRWWPE
jgi:hypothetical protein